jgi:hypothetical protein
VTARIVLSLLACASVLAAESVVCKTIADTYVYATPWRSKVPEDSEAFENHGHESQVVLMGREYFALLQFDLAPIKGMTVRKATLRMHLNPNRWPLSTVGISTISGVGPWVEDSANYFFARTREQPWAYAGSDLSDVTFGLGGSLYAYPQAHEVGDWYEIDVPPALVYALTTGDQFGWLLSDEKGQTHGRFSLSSREQSRWQPVLLVEGARTDQTPPGPVRKFEIENTPEAAHALGRTNLRPGSVLVRFGAAGDDNGSGVATRYELRYSSKQIDENNFNNATPVPRWMLDPLAPKPHPLATSNALRDTVTAIVEDLKPGENYFFAARATDKAGNVGPVSALGRYRTYNRAYPSLPAVQPAQPVPADQRRLRVVPELVKINPRTGEALEAVQIDLWSVAPTGRRPVATVKLTGARNEFVAFQLVIPSEQPVSVSVSQPLFKTELYRECLVPDGDAWYPDPLIPMSEKCDPAPGQKVQIVFVDIYIPHDAQPGVHSGQLRALNQEIDVQLEVLPFALPDQNSFVVDLNGYGGVNGAYHIKPGTPEYRKLVAAYHRLAHLHRANVDILGYSHSGLAERDYSPPLTGEGANTRVASWTDFDAHFGPLLDGSAFRDLPRASVPITNMYLNFSESWPGDLHANYRWDNFPTGKTTEEYKQIMGRQALAAGPIEDGFPQSYQDRFTAVIRQFAEHFRQRGWTRTMYQVFFNDKHYYKDPAKGGRGVSWWLLDEPNFRDDYRALSFFGWLTKRGLADYPDVPMIFRTDISYIDFMRDLLTGQIDLNCTSKHFFTRNRYLMDHRERFGSTFWNYASTNHPRESNIPMRSWCWRVWAAGGDGVVPWEALADAKAWEHAEKLTVFYPGSKYGKAEPYASLRLKAFRRGEQDVEYLVMLARKKGWDREAVSKALGEVDDSKLDELRLRVARAIVE